MNDNRNLTALPWKFNLIAPRQGLFASLLLISFALHTVFLVMATTHQLNANRNNQGLLMTSQLVNDSVTELTPPNTVSLALLLSRYATNPSVAAIRVLDPQNQVLATAGMAKTRQGEIFVRDVLRNDKKVGRVEVTLIQPSVGEILRTQWPAILAFLILHALLWLLYRQIARPSRSEWLAQKNTEALLRHEIEQLNQALVLEKQNIDALMQQQKTVHDGAAHTLLSKALNNSFNKNSPLHAANGNPTAQALVLNIQFYDPKQLMQSLSASLSASYCNVCQKFLTLAIMSSCKHYAFAEDHIELLQKIGPQGAQLRSDAQHPNAAACLTLIGAVFQALMDTMYHRYRESRRFALQSRFAVSSAVQQMQLPAEQAAARLCQLLQAKEAAIQLDHASVTALQAHYNFNPMQNPIDALTRQTLLIVEVSAPLQSVIQDMQQQILQGSKT